MKNFFRPNLDHRGRIARGVIGCICLMAGIITVDYHLATGLALVVAGLFGIFEAVRGWCLARACGLKTKL